MLVSGGTKWCLYSWLWNSSRHFFPLGEAWLCHSRSLQNSAASIWTLLAAFPSLGCSGEAFGKDVSILGFLPVSIATLLLLLRLPFLASSLHMPCFQFFFCKLILLMWCECHEFSPLPLGFLAWPSSFFLCPISSCQPWLSTIEDACPHLPICLCLSYSINPAFSLPSHQFWTFWY